ncbi:MULTISPECIES: DUF982 domain-containing protein [Sinorhizobium/Ensifer group]|uniref:DUF982 domain-containing protein n=1 Tax=Sinorhizobium fredii (strain HH103) TaxID=1117943 RepID=G9AC33_SINF1|nr:MULTISPECIES: DUF982 domain-containing protein [Sinorhizobium]MCK3780929.1 DUF982 domain-containing protein [Ensifer sesbaniae]AWI62181.1 hypothetical protein AB395_00006558 [Sinorhizobium fredii CCBAU 45436]AWM29992.1 hypothetical protein AOX55_00004558 [Sinorhizobium fredii CCBAU 25509]MQW95345.1 DUF982 domain-containing protein [Sinorhizobium fredii]UTY47743.1 DUF982 domain-containing protein [Sinorhizobium fredii]
MSDIQFPVPVRLHLNSAGERVVANSWEALECLRDHWPEGARGRTYRAAYRVCRDVLDGWRQPYEARRAFVKAARRAGLLEDIALVPPPSNARTKPDHRHAVRYFRPIKGR